MGAVLLLVDAWWSGPESVSISLRPGRSALPGSVVVAVVVEQSVLGHDVLPLS